MTDSHITGEYLALLLAWSDEMRAPFENAITEAVEALCAFGIYYRRICFADRLSKWMPDYIARFIASYWPERWLPALEVEAIEDDQ